MGQQVGGVVDDLDKCDEERAELKVEKAELTDKVKSLTTLLKNCDDQVADILKSVKDMKNIKGTKKDTMGAKTKAKPATALQKEAGSVISYAVKGALARKKMVM
jgi:predicted  nucleic acid-binding Zn-ribbon protein